MFFVSLFAKAQKKEYKFGVIPKEYLTMKQYPLDTSADAVVICDIGEWRVADGTTNWVAILRKHRQIKILKKTAFEHYGEVILPFRSKDNDEQMEDVEAMVTHPNGLQETLSKKQIFTEKLDKNYSILKFTFTGLQEGDVVEYAYTKVSNTIQFIGPWYFQEDVPIVHSEIFFTAGERLEYQFVYSGYLTPDKTTPNEAGVLLSIDSIPALKANEVFITTTRDYCAAVSFQLTKYVGSDGLDHTFLDTWQNVANILENAFSFGNVYNLKSSYSNVWKICKPLLENVSNDNEKVEIIYNFVNEKVKWDNTFSMASDLSLNDVLKKGKGSSGEINLMMVALLREAGLKANPMLISTREHGKVSEIYPLINQFNHVLCHIQIGDKKIVLDGGNENRPAGMLKTVSLTQRGWIIDRSSSRWENIPSNFNSQTVVYSNLELNDEGELKGDITFSYQNYAAVSVREYNNENEFNTAIKKEMISYYPDIQIDSIITKQLKDMKSAVKKVVYCKIPNAVIVNGDFLYIKPIAFSGFDKNPFKAVVRNFPVDMPYCSKEQILVNLKIPKNYVIESMPKSSILNLFDTSGKSTFLCENKNGEKIVINSTIQLNVSIFSPEEYMPLKSFYSSIVSKFEEQIVLKKQ